MIADFLDRNAATRACGNTWLDVTFAAAPATVAAVLAVSDQLTRWLSFLPGMMLVVHVALPTLAMFATAVMVVSKRERERRTGFVADDEPRSSREYRFCSAARQTAKFAFVAMVLITLASYWMAMPNALRGVRTTAGYVCTADGHALNGAFIQLYDRYERPVTTSVATDDRGFFFVEVAGSKTRPVLIRMTAGCEPSSASYPFSSALRGRSCPVETIESPQTGEAPVWITQCR